MPLHVLYIEDNPYEREELEKAISKVNEREMPWRRIELRSIDHPRHLADALNDEVDVVLADVHFEAPPGSDPKKLDDIISAVREWDKRSSRGFPVPIIACTSKGEATLQYCHDRRADLYDIWSKLSTFPPYVAWRFQRLAAELPRFRPDATIQKLVAAMPVANCPQWHPFVLHMVRKYSEGQTEYEQVRKCRDPIQSITNYVSPEHAVGLMALWDVLADSEPLLKAASPKLRGLARHSINVFWFGYWLINHPLLRDQLSGLWVQMLEKRADAAALRAVEPHKGLNAAWVLCSLFHDAGKFHEQGKAVTEEARHFFQRFASLDLGAPSWIPGKTKALPQTIDELLFALKEKNDDPMVARLQRYLKKRWLDENPDHGAIAAGHLLSIGGGAETKTFFGAIALEAARAILLHSALPGVLLEIPKDQRASSPHLEWNRDLLASLLLFCDQVQTWDRHNPGRDRQDYPDRAELAYLELTSAAPGGRPELKGCIDYIAPARVELYPELRREIAESLNKVILEKPKDALLHVLEHSKWPFTAQLSCALSGEPLSVNLEFA